MAKITKVRDTIQIQEKPETINISEKTQMANKQIQRNSQTLCHLTLKKKDYIRLLKLVREK